MPVRSIQSTSTPARIGSSLQIRLSCDYDSVRRAAAQLRAFLTGHQLMEKELWACELAFVEGCNNAVRYTPPAKINVDIVVEAACSEGNFELRIQDHTTGFDLPEGVHLPPADSERGRGLFLMKSLMDQVRYVRTETINCLVLNKKLTGL